MLSQLSGRWIIKPAQREAFQSVCPCQQTENDRKSEPSMHLQPSSFLITMHVSVTWKQLPSQEAEALMHIWN